MSNNQTSSKVFLDQNIYNIDIRLKKLLLLDYMIYYDEKDPNEQKIKSLSSGKIPIELKTKNIIDNGSIALFPIESKESIFRRDYPFFSYPKKRRFVHEYEDKESEGEGEQENYMDEYDDEDDEEYNKMMREIDNDIQDDMMKEMISDRNNKLDEQDYYFKVKEKPNKKLEKLQNKPEDDEWEDIDNLENDEDINEEDLEEIDYEVDTEEENDEDVLIRKKSAIKKNQIHIKRKKNSLNRT